MSDIKRRVFLKDTLTGMGSAFIPTIVQEPLLREQSYQDINNNYPKPLSPKKVVVAGAGLAGLCCAYELMKKGHDVTVLEASGRHGGHVFTVRDGLSDGLYADGGAEQITRPGYERYWEYTKEFNLEVLPYPRRKNMIQKIDGKYYTDEMLADPGLVKKFGFNERETKYIAKNSLWDLSTLFIEPYLKKFKDEYQPFGIGYDDLDSVPLSEIFKKEGASKTALGFLGGNNASALFALWRAAILHIRGVPPVPRDLFRLKGGNQMLPDAFARRLGARVKLNSSIISIAHSNENVTVTYKSMGEVKEMTADFLANCIPLPAFKKIPVTPEFPPEKQYVINNVTYDSYSHFIFQASSKFWLDDGFKSINMELGHPDISSIWQVADEVDTHRVVLLATGPGGVSAERALAGFREAYPGKRDTIEQALVKDWTKDLFSATCERLNFPMGELKKFWPHIMTPSGRIHFAGAYADNLNWGQEAATRSANRVAKEIDQA